MKIIAFTKNNPKYKIFNHPQEDSFKFAQSKNETIVAVADGITRDPIGITNFPEKQTNEEIKELSKRYPRPSPAKKAADLFCNSIIKKLKSPSQIEQAVAYANNQISQLNKKNIAHPDYLENDFWACVAACGIIHQNFLHYSYICDCGICVFNSQGKLKLITKDDGPTKHDAGIWSSPDLKGKKWSQAQARKIQRSRFRNNPQQKHSYGAFTGEETALHFVRYGRIKLNPSDLVLFFTDGMKPFLTPLKFGSKISLEVIKNYIEANLEKIGGSEGTLVGIHID